MTTLNTSICWQSSPSALVAHDVSLWTRDLDVLSSIPCEADRAKQALFVTNSHSPAHSCELDLDVILNHFKIIGKDGQFLFIWELINFEILVNITNKIKCYRFSK